MFGIYRLTHSVSELSGFTNNKREISIPLEAAEWGIEYFLFIVRKQVQVNPDNSWTMSMLTFYYSNWMHCKQKLSNFESEAMVSWQCCIEFTPRLLHHDNDIKEVVSSQPTVMWYKSTNQKIRIRTVYEIWIINRITWLYIMPFII